MVTAATKLMRKSIDGMHLFGTTHWRVSNDTMSALEESQGVASQGAMMQRQFSSSNGTMSAAVLEEEHDGWSGLRGMVGISI